MAQVTPSRFRALVHRWAARGVCLPSSVKADIGKIAGAGGPEWNGLLRLINLNICRFTDEVPGRPSCSLSEWEHALSASGWIVEHGDSILELLTDSLSSDVAVAVIDPYFWSNEAPTKAGRARFMDAVKNAAVPRLTVISGDARSKEDRDACIGRMNWTRQQIAAARVENPTVNVEARIRRAGPMFHDRFYAVVPSGDEPERGTTLFAMHVGPGIRAFQNARCVSCVLALDGRDFAAAWRAASQGADRVHTGSA